MIDMRDAFFERLVELAKEDERIIFLTADHGAFSLKEFEKEMPSRYINVGISEQSMVGVAAGLAASGKIVFAYGIAPFVSLRVLEQLTLDVAAMQLPVNIVSVGAGFTYSTDGPTHQGLQDLPAVLTIPKMTVLNSSDPANTRGFVDYVVSRQQPHYIRIEKEKLDSFKHVEIEERLIDLGFSVLKKGRSKTIVVATGCMTHSVLEFFNSFNTNENDSVTVVDLFQIKPLSLDFLCYLGRYEKLITVEEGYVSGMGSAISRALSINDIRLKEIYNFGIDEDYYFSADNREVMVDFSEIKGKIMSVLGSENEK